MALKVVSSYTPKVLSVGNNYNGLGVGYNPQQAAPLPVQTYSPQQAAPPPVKTYNPQPAASVTQAATTTPAQFQAANLRYRQEQDRLQAERVVEKKRLADAVNNEVLGKKSNLLKSFGSKVSFEALRKQRGGRELAVKYLQDNEQHWGSQIIARQRNYEKGGAEFKDWVMQAETEDEYNKRVAHANWWLEKEYNEINADIDDYTKTQSDLAQYSETPLKGKFATIGRTSKNVVAKVGSTSLNTLGAITHYPSRLINTAGNLNTPGRTVYETGGTQKTLQAGWKNAYNASEKQRNFNIKPYTDKPYDRAEAEKKYGAQARKDADFWKNLDGKKINWYGGTSETNKDMKNPELKDYEYQLKRYWNENNAKGRFDNSMKEFLADPVNYIPAGKIGETGTKVLDKTLPFLGKSEKLRNLIISAEASKSLFKESKFGRIASKLNEEWLPRGTKAKNAAEELAAELQKTSTEYKIAKSGIYDKFGGELKVGNKAKSEFLTKQAAHMSRLTADAEGHIAHAKLLNEDYVKRLNNFSDSEVRSMTRFARNGSWTKYDKFKLGKSRIADLEQFVTDYQSKAGVLAKSEGLTNKASHYLPEFTGRGYDPTARRTLFGEKYLGQGKQQLQESLIMRDFVSNWDESNTYLKQLAATEKSILRNARKTSRALTKYEAEQLQIIADRKHVLERLNNRYDTRFNGIRDAMQRVRQDAQPAFKIRANGGKFSMTTNFTKKGFENSLVDAYHFPMKIWKKAVLKYNPAWYVNNTAWNVPASVSAAGADVFEEYGKLLTSRKYWNEIRKTIPEGVMSKLSQEVGKAGLATKIEDTSRVATFMALRKKGFSDEKALKVVNRWLFDYGTKNWERPIKGVLPFWQWQKNIIRLGLTMPFHNPRSAKVYSTAYNKFYKEPYEKLPSEPQSYTDPETGKTVTYDPRKFYKGKANIGNNWYGLPFFAVNPETALQFGINPYAVSAADYLTSTDRLENKNTDRAASTILGERFPQINLGRAAANKNNMDTEKWFSQSGNSKIAQGYDKTKPNYKEGLDNERKYKNSVKSFLGIPRGVKFDKNEYELKKRLTDFDKEFFAVNWKDKLKALKDAQGENYLAYNDPNSPYNQIRNEQVALAKKFGFDLQKDIFDNYWSKYDSETTANTKRLKKEAFDFNGAFWRDYLAIPQGNKTTASQRRPFLIGKFDEWKRDHTFAKNGYYDIPEFSVYDTNGKKTGEKAVKNPFALKREENESQARRAEGKRKYQRKLEYEKAQRTGDWSWFDSHPSNRKTGYKQDGKFFKSAESAQRYKTGQLWREYYSLGSTAEKQAFLAQHPELKKFDQPKTQADWDRVKLLLRTERKDKLSQLSGFLPFKQAAEQKAMKLAPRRKFKRVKFVT